ncbi:MAG: hypothetical protein OEV08_00035 [Nitrospira sp.]|nr:hypothetical protein [Nitrospira sp.]
MIINLRDLWDFADLEATEAHLRATLAVAETRGDNPLIAALLSQFARLDGLRGHFDAGQQHIAQSRAYLPTGPSWEGACVLLEEARLDYARGCISQAGQGFETALRAAEDCGAVDVAIDALHMCAIVSAPQEAIVWSERAEQKVLESGAEMREWLGPILNNRGWAHVDVGDLAQALRCFERDVALREETGSSETRQIAEWNSAHVLRLMGRLDDATAIQLRLAGEIGNNGKGIGYVFEELAEIATATGNDSQAATYARDALAIYRRTGMSEDSEPQRFQRLESLARCNA